MSLKPSTRREQTKCFAALVPLVVAAIVALASSGCEKPKIDQPPQSLVVHAIPLLQVYRWAAYSPRRKPEYSGLVAAVWADGRMVRLLGSTSVSPDNPSYEDGTLAQSDLETLKLAIHSLGLDVAKPDEQVILHSAVLHARVWTGGKVIDRAGSLPAADDSPYSKLLTKLTDVPVNRRQLIDSEAVAAEGLIDK